MSRIKRQNVVLMLLLVLAFALALNPTQAFAKTGWSSVNGKWRYYVDDNNYCRDEIRQINNKFYRFDAQGNMVTGWYGEKYGDYTSWYYFGKDGAALTGWQRIGGTWYFFENGKNGSDDSYLPWAYAYGIYPIGNSWYYFNEDGAMGSNGWQKHVETWTDGAGNKETYTTWYYAKSSGALATGWQYIGGAWYYFYPEYPNMVSNVLMPIGNDLYFFKPSGAMATGWQKQTFNWEDDSGVTHTDTEWYYLKSNGAAAKGWVKDGGKWYYMYFDKDEYGYTYHMYSDGFYQVNGKTYYFNKGGDMAVGWKQIGGAWYYFNSGGDMATNKWVGNYYLKADGTMAVNEWIGKYHVDGNGKWDKTK